jgi:hypothetical protein
MEKTVAALTAWKFTVLHGADEVQVKPEKMRHEMLTSR